MTEPQKHRYPFTVGAEITIVGHGYQIDVIDASRATADGNGRSSEQNAETSAVTMTKLKWPSSFLAS